jgi:hypothetical protein
MNIYYRYDKPNKSKIHPEFPYYVSPIRKKLQNNKNNKNKKKPFCEWFNTYLFNKSHIKTTIKTNTNNIILNQSDSPFNQSDSPFNQSDSPSDSPSSNLSES